MRLVRAVDGVTVLYEDNHLLIVVKPPNVPVQSDASGDDDLLSQAKRYIAEKYGKPGAVYIGLVHRLDRPVGGVVAFARTSKAAARLSEQIRTHAMRREYLCVARGALPEQGELVHWLVKDERTNTSRAVSRDTPGVREARLSYACVDRKDGLSLTRVRLHTGRSHQIRVQFSTEGFPLWGDARYGGGRPGEQIALFARSINLEHPTRRQCMHFCANPPDSFPWSLFVIPDFVV